MDGLARLFQVLTPGRIIALIVSMAIVAAMFSFLFTQLQTANMSLLYGGLTPTEASEISGHLDTLGVPYQIRGESAVFVPANRVGELRLSVAGAGLVGGNGNGYEIFDNMSSFGTTALVQNINARRAMEGELARTISTLPAVQSARVHLVLPSRQAFSRETITPSAAVTLNLGSRVLTDDQVNSISQLVAAAVPNLSTNNVTIIDQRSNLLSGGSGVEGRALTYQSRVQNQIESDYETSITKMIEKVVGVGKVAVKVTTDLNFDRIEENIETFDPEQQVVRSEQVSEQTLTSQSRQAGGSVGVAGNVPGGDGGSGQGTGSTENQIQTETTTNYEIGKSVKHILREGGATKRISVAVLVEGGQSNDDVDGSYTPMTDAQKQNIEALVRTAIGYNEQRGDSVEIIDMPFETIPEPPAVEEPMFSKADIMTFVQYGAILIGMIFMILFVLRPLLKAFSNITVTNTSSGAAAAALGSAAAASGGGGAAAMPTATGGGGGRAAAMMQEEESTIDISQVKGRVKESKVRHVAEIVDAYPEESLGVVRGWMAESPK